MKVVGETKMEGKRGRGRPRQKIRETQGKGTTSRRVK